VGAAAVRKIPPLRLWPILISCVLGATLAEAASSTRPSAVSQIQVRIVTGLADLSAGSYVELRIYEAGKAVRRLPLTHGEAWPHDTTRIIPLNLGEGLDPGSVLRFGIYYRAANPLSPPWEVVAADVDLSAGREPQQLLLNTTLSGEIAKQGELASADRDLSSLSCMSDADCDDHKSCNGRERCAPHAPGADARGCVSGTPVVCPVNQVCVEGRGCVGAMASTPAPAAADAATPATASAAAK